MVPLVRCNIFLTFGIILLISTVVHAAPAEIILHGTDAGNRDAGPFSITLFTPSEGMIHSDQILDTINTPQAGVLFATTYGLSMYNGTWSTRHINHDNISEGLMDDYITAVEYDHDGNLWIGYSGGIQIYNGVYYQTLRDQQLFKDPRIQDIQRWEDDMWVATGHSGIHRYHDGTWTWFQPMSKDGPGFYEIDSMTIDPAGNILAIATPGEGTWIVRSGNDPVRFEQIAPPDGTYGYQQHVRRDPLGGVFFFNRTGVVRYTTGAGFSPVLSVQDLSHAEIAINDLTAAPDGELYLATDDGFYIWKDNAVYRHVSRFEGIGTSQVVRTIFTDARNRVWFSTNDYVGYYQEQAGSEQPISIHVVTPAGQTAAVTPLDNQSAVIVTPTLTRAGNDGPTSLSGQGGLAPVLDPIMNAIHTILVRIGLVPDSG
jgi:ligand-binding sensor domain-containing protein